MNTLKQTETVIRRLQLIVIYDGKALNGNGVFFLDKHTLITAVAIILPVMGKSNPFNIPAIQGMYYLMLLFHTEYDLFLQY